MTRKTTLYTIGYEGRTLPLVVRALTEHRIEFVVDVREAARSRVKGFNLMQLFEGLNRCGISYEHVRELGNPSEIRRLFRAGKLDAGRSQFRALLQDGRAAAIEGLIDWSRVTNGPRAGPPATGERSISTAGNTVSTPLSSAIPSPMSP
jgi:hypothetical protein